jgi:hypothetical protein
MYGVLIGSLLLFVHDNVRVKSIRDDKGCQSGAPIWFVRGATRVKSTRWLGASIRSLWLIYMRRYACKKISEMVRGINQVPLTDFDALVHWPCMLLEVSPLCRSGTLISICAKLRGSSWCAKTLIALCNSGNRTLKADLSLIDLIMKLKPDCPKIQEYLRVS